MSSSQPYPHLFSPLTVGSHVLANRAIMGSMPPEYAGAGAGILSITRLLGQVTGISVIGSLWAARVVALSGDASLSTNASAGPPALQIQALRDVYLGALPWLASGIVIAVWGLTRERAGVSR